MAEDTRMSDVEISYPHLILPGETLSSELSHSLKLGPGLRHASSATGETLIQATQAGLLHKTKQSEFYVDYNSHRVCFLSLILTIVRSKSRRKRHWPNPIQNNRLLPRRHQFSAPRNIIQSFLRSSHKTKSASVERYSNCLCTSSYSKQRYRT
jgi:hypothetical protein